MAAFEGESSGEAIELGNEFAQIRVRKIMTRNGARLLIESPKTGRAIALCPLELESLTWQTTESFSRMLAHPDEPLPPETGE